MINSLSKVTGSIALPLIEGEFSMIPFSLQSLVGLQEPFRAIAEEMLKGVKRVNSIAYFTLHGKILKSGGTLRRGSPHTDGNYEPVQMSFGGGGGNGWKVGERGPELGSELHNRQYLKDTGGIIICSNFESCLGWEGTFSGTPKRGGDCRHIKLNEPFMLKKDSVYYGNNHFIHESLPVTQNVHRVMARITLPEDHQYLN